MAGGDVSVWRTRTRAHSIQRRGGRARRGTVAARIGPHVLALPREKMMGWMKRRRRQEPLTGTWQGVESVERKGARRGARNGKRRRTTALRRGGGSLTGRGKACSLCATRVSLLTIDDHLCQVRAPAKVKNGAVGELDEKTGDPADVAVGEEGLPQIPSPMEMEMDEGTTTIGNIQSLQSLQSNGPRSSIFLSSQLSFWSTAPSHAASIHSPLKEKNAVDKDKKIVNIGAVYEHLQCLEWERYDVVCRVSVWCLCLQGDSDSLSLATTSRPLLSPNTSLFTLLFFCCPYFVHTSSDNRHFSAEQPVRP